MIKVDTISDTMIPTAGIARTNRILESYTCPLFSEREVHPMIIAAQVAYANDPNKSAPMPATSPTLSPTLSAMVAGFRGLSSGRDDSSFPTRSEPKSAAFVKIPPPTRANNATVEPPRPYPATDSKRRSKY